MISQLCSIAINKFGGQKQIFVYNQPSVSWFNCLLITVGFHMNKLSELSDDQLRELLTTSRQMLNSLVTSLNDRSDMQDAIARLMEPDNMLETFYELASAEPDLMRLVLQASVAALLNVQSLDGSNAELKRRAIKGN